MTPLTTDATWSPSRNFWVSAPVLFVSSGSTTACQVPSSPSLIQLLSGFGLHSLPALSTPLVNAPLMVMRTLRSAAWL